MKGTRAVIAAVASLTFGIIEGPNAGWTSPMILVAFGSAASSLLGVLRYRDTLLAVVDADALINACQIVPLMETA